MLLILRVLLLHGAQRVGRSAPSCLRVFDHKNVPPAFLHAYRQEPPWVAGHAQIDVFPIHPLARLLRCVWRIWL